MSELFLEYKKRPGRAGLAELLERHQDAVYSLCYRVLRHPQDAEDACQEVLLEVSRQVDAIEQPAGFAGWLYRTTLHTALDVKRQRGRRKVREAAVGRASRTEPEADDAREALHRGLARLDQTSRTLVVEHYLAQRPLRELADERGCSEVAVWKRLRNARERLRCTLGDAAATDHGGFAMAVKAGIKIAVIAPLILLAAAGLIAVLRQPEPQVVPKPSPRQVTKPPAVRPTQDEPAPKPAPAPTPAPDVPKPTSRKPYPLGLRAEGISDAARHAWRQLSQQRLDLDYQNMPMDSLLRTIAGKLGIALSFELPPEAGSVSFKVLEVNGDSCLRLLLIPRQLAYEIRPDGSVFVGPHDKISGGVEKEGQAMQTLQYEVSQIHGDMDRGWDGIGDMTEKLAATDRALREKKVLMPQEITTWMKVIERINSEYGQTLLIDAAAVEAAQQALDRPFPSAVEEPKMGTLIERMARELNLSWCVLDSGTVLLGAEAQIVIARGEVAERAAVHRRDLDRLQKRVTETGPSTVPDFLDSISRAGLRIMPEEVVWESTATVTVAPGSTLRQALDQLKPLGFRWAIRNGSIYVVR